MVSVGAIGVAILSLDAGLVIIVWGAFGGDQMVQYVANADRPECSKAMAALLDAWGQGMPDIPYHERN